MGLDEVPRPVRPGEPVSARLFNALRSLALRARVTRVGDGLVMKQTAAGTTLALAGGAVEVRLARIASDYPQVETAHAGLTYDVTLLHDGRTLHGLTPLNRPVRPEHKRKVIPARLGSICLVLYPRAKKLAAQPAKHLLVFDEVIPEVECTTGGGGDSGVVQVPMAMLMDFQQRLAAIEAGR